MQFTNLRNATNKHFDETAEKFRAELESVTCGHALDHWYWRDRMTAAAFTMVKEADPAGPIPEAAQKKIFARFIRENEKNRGKYLAKIAAAEAAPDITAAHIDVEWKKSAVWGYNPTAEITGQQRRTSGHASGCGYDKQSAAIASAANVNPEIMRILYKHAENGGVFPYSVNTWAGLPYFDGGCGVSCFYNVFDACGYSWVDVAHGKIYDVYRLEVKK